MLLMSSAKSVCLRRIHIGQRSLIRLLRNSSGAPNYQHSMLDVWSGRHAHFVGWVSCTSYSSFGIRAFSSIEEVNCTLHIGQLHLGQRVMLRQGATLAEEQ